MFYLTTHSTHFIYGYKFIRHMLQGHSERERKTRCSKESFICTLPQVDSTYHSLCYSSWGALFATRNSSMGPPLGINPVTHCTTSERCTTELHFARCQIRKIMTFQPLQRDYFLSSSRCRMMNSDLNVTSYDVLQFRTGWFPVPIST